MKRERVTITRLLCIGLAVLLFATTLPVFTVVTQGDGAEENFFTAIPNMDMPGIDFNDLTYSTSTGEWVFAFPNGLYYYNPDSQDYNDSWRLEASDVELKAVETTPWGVAAAGSSGADGMMLVERENYANGSTVQPGDLDLAKSVSATAESYGYVASGDPVEHTLFYDGFEEGLKADWENNHAYFDQDAYIGNWAKRIDVEAGSNPASSAYLSSNLGTETIFNSGSHQETVYWNADYTGMKHTVSKNVVPANSGTGTPQDPFMIYDVWDLQNMNANLGAHYALANDIDASATIGWNGGAGFVPIGTGGTPFTGSLDGMGHSITGLYINRPATTYVGLFGYSQGAEVKNVNVQGEMHGNWYVGGIAGYSESCSISSSSTHVNVNGVWYVGGLVGRTVWSTISNSYATGESTGDYRIGGLIGRNEATVMDCYATGMVRGGIAGGLIGESWGGEVTNSYATGEVRGDVDIGGFAGLNLLAGVLNNNYATGTVTRISGSSTNIGGFVGRNHQGKIFNCYSTGFLDVEIGDWLNNNGFAGSVDIGGNYEMYGNFWDMETSGQPTTEGDASGRTTSQMRIQSTFTGWDFTTTWHMTDGVTYPLFLWQPLPFSGGSGTEEDPIMIYNVEDLQAMNSGLVLHYALANDIDASQTSGWNWNGTAYEGFFPVGNSSALFTGGLDGRNHTITGLYINRTGDEGVGLFGRTDSSLVQNVVLEDANIAGGNYVGLVVGYSDGGAVSNVHVTGNVTGQNRLGGVMGSNTEGILEFSSFSGSVTGTGVLGGLVGETQRLGGYGRVSNSFSNATVSGTSISIGGLVGDNQLLLNDSYAKGTVTGSSWYVGGLVGYNQNSGQVINTYSTVFVIGGSTYYGGLVGRNSGTVSDSFWDIETSGQNESEGGSGKTTAEMKTQSTFMGWNFTDTWWMSNGWTYPLFRWEPLDVYAHGIDYIRIVDTPNTGANLIISGDVFMGENITGYSAGFNFSFGYMMDVEASWSITTGVSPGHMNLSVDVTAVNSIQLSYTRKISGSSPIFFVEYSLDGGAWTTLEEVYSSEVYTPKSQSLDVSSASTLSLRWYLDGSVGDSTWIDEVEISGWSSASYTTGDYVYHIPNYLLGSETVEPGMFRVSAFNDGVQWYPAGSEVFMGDGDVGLWLDAFSMDSIFMTHNPWSMPLEWSMSHYDIDLYYDADMTGTISPGDIRLTSVKVFDHARGAVEGVSSNLNAISVSDNHGVLAVGNNGAIVRYHNSNGDWVFSAASNPLITSDHDFHAVAYTGGVWVVVGRDIMSLEPVAFAFSSSLAYCEQIVLPTSQRLNSASGSDGIVIMVGDNGAVVVYNTVSKVASIRTTGVFEILNVVRWKWDGAEAIIGGDTGRVYIYHRESDSFHDVTNTTFGLYRIIAIGVKAPSSPGHAYLLRNTVGSRDVIGYSFQTPVPLDDPTQPHISDFDIRIGANSRKKGMVDVGSTLTFYIDAHYPGGWSNVNITLEGWHDMGDVGLSSGPPGAVRESRNTYFKATYSGATANWTMEFPSAPAFPGWETEFTLVDWTESSALEADGYTHYYLSVDIQIGEQMRSTNNPGGGGFPDAGDETPGDGFNNPNTWDVRLTLQAGAHTTSRYTELGVYKYTGLSASGYPVGSAPPDHEARLYPNAVLRIVSNCAYIVTVEVDDLVNSGNIIFADNVAVRNPRGLWLGGAESDIVLKNTFISSGMPMNVWGSGGLYVPPPDYGTTAMGSRPGGLVPGRNIVQAGDPDDGLRIYSLAGAATNNSAGYPEPGDQAYVDVDSNGNVSEGDIRIYHPFYPQGSIVSAGDMDVGGVLYAWENAMVTNPDGEWDSATGTVYHSLDSYVNPGDHRVTVFYGDTVIEWWINIPLGTSPGRYTGTALVKIQHEV